MKFCGIIKQTCRPGAEAQGIGGVRPAQAGFTLVEIALALAVIGFALVAIIGVLPLGMNVQRENREETIINHDAMVLLEAIRTGAKRFDELTNYVDAIWVSNLVTVVNAAGAVVWSSSSIASVPVRSGAQLIGLMSTPTVYLFGFAQPGYVVAPEFTTITNAFVILHMRALTGQAVEKPPQTNRTILEGAFSYRLEIQVVPCFVPVPGDLVALPRLRVPNLHEVRLRFRWPLLPNGRTGPGRQSFCTRVSGALTGPFYLSAQPQLPLYFFEPTIYVQPSGTL